MILFLQAVIAKPVGPPPGFEKVIVFTFFDFCELDFDCSCNLQVKPNMSRGPHPGVKSQGAGYRPGGASGRRVQQVSTQSAFRFND